MAFESGGLFEELGWGCGWCEHYVLGSLVMNWEQEMQISGMTGCFVKDWRKIVGEEPQGCDSFECQIGKCHLEKE